jgi:hypothetical protein
MASCQKLVGGTSVLRRGSGWVLGCVVAVVASTALMSHAAYAKPTFKSCADATRIQLKSCTPFVLNDTLPGNDYYENGSRSATRRGRSDYRRTKTRRPASQRRARTASYSKAWISRCGSEPARTSSTSTWSRIDSGSLPRTARSHMSRTTLPSWNTGCSPIASRRHSVRKATSSISTR